MKAVREKLLPLISVNKPSLFLSYSEAERKKTIDLSSQYLLTGLLYSQLKAQNILEEISPSLTRYLRSYWENTAAKNMMGIHQLREILQLLNKEKIDTIILKGLYFAEQIYPSLGTRPMSDIDILLHREDIEKADCILKKNGYVSKWNKTWIDKFHYHYGYFPPIKNQFFLEVHWLLAKPDSPFCQDIEKIFQRSREYTIEGESTRVLTPEDQIIYLSIHHAWSHGFKVNLIQFYDLVLLFEKLEIDQNKLISVAGQYRATNATYLTLVVVNFLFKKSIDENLLTKLKPPGFSEQWIEMALEIIFDQHQNLNTAFSRFMFTDKTYRKVFSFIKSVFPEKRVLSEIYQLNSPELVRPIHYCRRIIDLIDKYKPTALEYLWKNKHTRKSFKNERKKNQVRSLLIDS